jgi:adenine-specific DNA-methyltransferase
MTIKKGKLELTWVGKDERVRLEPRVLVEDPEKSYGDPKSENMLIYGDNLLALKALEQDFAEQIKCIFIDPPYNTGSAFSHYPDGLEHSIWLSMMRDRLVVLCRLLADRGSIWITIDDNEAHYLKVVCDEIFGRENFVANVIWEKAYSERMDSGRFSASHDHILVYRKTALFSPIPISKPQNSKQFGWYDDRVRKHYRRRSLRKEGSESLRSDRHSMWYPIKAPDGTEIYPIKPDGTEGRWRWKEANVFKHMEILEFVEIDGKWEIYVKQYLNESATRPPATLWKQEEVGHNHEAKLEAISFNKEDVFDTPKPERLLKKALEISTLPGDIVLDSFAGSGTTGAVAHKMGRRWIMCELGEHCHTHIIPRLKKVIDGTDLGGISVTSKTKAAVKLCKACTELLCEKCAALVGENSAGGEQIWFGGGGFKYYRLAESILVRDRDLSTKHHPVFVINPRYNEQMLIKAICKIEGFKYRNEGRLQGISSENRFLHVTTRIVTQPYLDSLADDLGPQQSLLLYSTKRSRRLILPDNVELKKIPRDLLDRCDFQEEK